MKALALASFLAFACAPSAPPNVGASAGEVAATPQERDARAFVEELRRHEWLAATQRFNREMAEAESPARVEAAWTRTEAEAGAWVGIERAQLEVKDRFRAAVLIGRFARHRRALRVVFDGEERVAGFWIRPVAEDLEATTRSLIDGLVRGDMAAATKDFDARMRESLPPPRLEETWKGLVANIGDFVAIENLRTKEEPRVSVVFATCNFARGKFLVKAAYRRDEVAGLWLLPADAATESVK
jgi:hypothetical protein